MSRFDRHPLLIVTLCLLATFPTGCSDGKEDESESEGAPPSELETSEDLDEALAQPPETWPRQLHYLRADQHVRLELEIDTQAGVEPDSQAVERVTAYLETLLDKPDGVHVVEGETLEPEAPMDPWQFDDLAALSEESFDGADDDETIRIHVMYVGGSYESDDGGEVLGLAWNHRSIAMFGESIESACSDFSLVGDSECRRAEQAILLHEVGHVLGLVDNGLPMVQDHRDPDHGHHDEDPDCLMYWAYEGEQVFDSLDQLLGSNGQLEFCPASVADIAAAQAG